MKKFLLVLFFLGGCILLSFAEGIAEESIRNSEKSDLSYAFGMAVAADLKQTGLEFNYTTFIRGFREVMENQQTLMSREEALEKVDAAIQTAMLAQAQNNLELERAFLLENAARPAVYTTSSGLQYEILLEGEGEQPSIDDFVKVNYVGFLTDGTVFDSSYERGEPEEFPLQGVIPGWSEGLQLMREGGRSRLFVPSKLAYGNRGIPNLIPPNSVIIFEVELLEVFSDTTGFYFPEDFSR